MTLTVRLAIAALATPILLTPIQSSAQDVRVPGPSSAGTGPGAPVYASITLYGCIERESDYRLEVGEKQGGLVGTGIGLGREFILTKASPRRSVATSRSGEGSSPSTEFATYQLTGPAEKDAADFVHQRVEISGHLKTDKKDLGLPRFAVLLVRQAPGSCE